jgi:hypothetical protein
MGQYRFRLALLARASGRVTPTERYDMKSNLALSLAAVLLPLSAAAAANEPSKEARALGVESSIVFPSDSSIRNWQADRDRGIWIRGRGNDWYYGTFAGFCRDLDFAQATGFETRGAGRLDKFASIIVRGERCQLSSFVTSAAPPSKAERKAAREAEKAAQN